ncbi:MAG: helix-turn-helix domain-containing protein [Lachnospiraceae bacterium]|nr:helix-turn-helix domain-containing protein [Lachnospiraceae bacterium]
MVYGLAEKLTLARKKLKMSQAQVAKRVGVSASAVSSYESGDKSPSIEVLIKLADLYKISADYLLGISYPREQAILDTSGLNKQQLNVLQSLIDIMK